LRAGEDNPVMMRSMRITLVIASLLAPVAGVASWAIGCNSSSITATALPAPDAASAPPACLPCISDQDCAGGLCSQIGGDAFCTPACPTGSECPADLACTSVVTVSGVKTSACVTRGDACGHPIADAGSPSMCGTFAAPGVKASCTCSRGQTCDPNGCYGGWWCDTSTSACHPPPLDCGNPAGGVPFDGGPPVTAQVGGDGGSMSRLLFGVVGDTRPANFDDTPGYPTEIITAIYSGIDGLASKPPFVVSTGDYMFASTAGTQAGPQLDLYLAAAAKYSGVLYPAMGNHECTGATASNCGADAGDGITPNYTTFLAKMLGAPLNKPVPYYSITLALDGALTAKLVFVAANAWSAEQQSWLDATLAQVTTYTFVVRHESAQGNTAPGVTPSEQVMAAHPYTLAIVGHSHTYSHDPGREIIVGNGGAPLTGSKNYGFAMVNQRPDGAIQVDMIDYQSLLADPTFHFAVNADGSPAP
jgi:hypothetical protein